MQQSMYLERGALRLQGKGDATITNSKIYAKSNKNCIISDKYEDNSQTVTINGKTLISNAEETTNDSGVISWKSPGQITINKDVTIEGMVGLNIYPNDAGHSANVNITGASISTKQTAISIKGGDGTLKLQNAKVIAGSNALNCKESYSVEIYDSYIENTGNSYGIKIMDMSGLVVERSTFKSDQATPLSIESPTPIRIIDSQLYGYYLPISLGTKANVSVGGASFLGVLGSAYNYLSVPVESLLRISGSSVLCCGIDVFGQVIFTDSSSLYSRYQPINIRSGGKLHVGTTGILARHRFGRVPNNAILGWNGNSC